MNNKKIYELLEENVSSNYQTFIFGVVCTKCTNLKMIKLNNCVQTDDLTYVLFFENEVGVREKYRSDPTNLLT